MEHPEIIAMLDPSGTTLLVLAAIVGSVAVLVLLRKRLPRPGGDFEIRHRPGGRAAVRGRVPASKLGAIRSFFERDLDPSGPVTVRGTFGPPPRRALRLDITGPLDAGQRQQVRNFLIAVLGR